MAVYAKRIALCGVVMIIAALPARADLRPIALYGENLTFDVLRDGVPAVSHTVSFSRDEALLLVKTQFGIEIKFLTFTAYRLNYSSKASLSFWKRGRMTMERLAWLRLDARTDWSELPVLTIAKR